MKINYQEVNLNNVTQLYNDWDGNLYYYDEDNTWQIVDGFELGEIKHAIKNGVRFIFIWGGQLNSESLAQIK